MSAASASSYNPDALDTNRAGRLTDDQRRNLGALDRDWRKNELVFTGILVALGLVVLTASGPAPNAWLRPFAGVGFFVAAAAVFIHSMPAWDSLGQDLRAGQVQSLESAMEKHTFTTHGRRGASVTSHFLDVGDRHFEVPPAVYAAAPQAGMVRVFFLPRCHKVLNFELLGDAPLPAGTLDAPVETLKTVLRDLRTTRGSEHHVAAAELAALGHAMEVERTRAATAPPADQRDPRPLAEAIVGTWQAGPMAISFAVDGTMETKAPAGRSRQGHWSVDGDGHLRADGMGHEQAVEAWVAADMLTIAADGQGIKLRRVTAG